MEELKYYIEGMSFANEIDRGIESYKKMLKQFKRDPIYYLAILLK